ncbi:putative disease resistance protein [Vitis vinifera]|uniref:Putative disease resistance protein n=1 Tax=Vitis vinifera TaxID=29760 RepID=A0A438GKT1_VITVI|nr:putative disease resistance protein [Vitis vinifera]
MEAQKSLKVECLTEDEAINLFKKKVGETTLNSHSDIPQLAEIAAKECQGLPLALITIGRAMAGKNTPQEWERAIQMLKAYPSKFSGFLDGFASIDEAFNQGHHIIEHLKTVCLFENGGFNRVKMHDVIRDMALWLDSEYRGNKNIILDEEVDAMEIYQVSKWKEAHRLYLSTVVWKNSLYHHLFPNLLTLIARSRGLIRGLKTFESRFFHFMPVIKVLDLSNAGITKLPTGIDEEEADYSRKDDKAIYLHEDNKALLEELEGLEHINWVSLPIVGLILHYLPNLRSISRRALTFPSLKTLRVTKCPNLRKLPLDSNSARNSLKIIEGTSEWWRGLQWEDETIQLTFTPYLNASPWRNHKMTFFSHALPG